VLAEAPAEGRVLGWRQVLVAALRFEPAPADAVLENRLLKTLTVSGSSMKEVRATADVRAPGHRRST